MKDGYMIDYISGNEVRATPEEEQAVQPFCRTLVEDYGYPKSVISAHPQFRVRARPSDTKKNTLWILQYLNRMPKTIMK